MMESKLDSGIDRQELVTINDVFLLANFKARKENVTKCRVTIQHTQRCDFTLP